MAYKTRRQKIMHMYEYYHDQDCSIAAFARRSSIDRGTIARYYEKFKKLEDARGGKRLCLDSSYFLPAKRKTTPTQLYLDLMSALPIIMCNCQVRRNTPTNIYEDYHKLYPNGYSFAGFSRIYKAWKKNSNVCVYAHRKVKGISEEDGIVLNQWRRGTDLEKWRKAVVIQGSLEGIPLVDLKNKVEVGMLPIQKWIANFNESGIEGLKKKQPSLEPFKKKSEERTKKVMAILHEPPNLHGFNRTTWRLEDLTVAYNKFYGETIGRTTIRMCVKNGGYRFRKARMVLTSPDPQFREKLDRVKQILANLKSDEKFFSMDEFGPFAIKMISGWSFQPEGQLKLVPQIQTSKGWLICTAAIELSTNQVTHFYSLKKNSDEMIKLVDILISQYPNDKKLYLSGDSASWHSSAKLKNHLERINGFAESNHNSSPYIDLVPLPSSSQFLNVIESVFSGLAKSVIHNSNYKSVDDCKLAIDKHFEKRNEYFKKNPKRAGKSIWGKEVVKPVFDSSHNCKDAIYAR